MESEHWKKDGLAYLELYVTTLERWHGIPRLSRAIHSTLHAIYCEALRAYYVLSEWMALTVAESEAYKARLDCLALYRFPRPPKVKI